MIKAIIVDDELNSVLTLRSLLAEYCPEVEVMGSTNSARNGKDLINTLKPELVFLDIEMPLGSGFELLQSLPSIQFEVVFITAYNQYAINAFRFSALDYLVKPVRITQLKEAVEKAAQRIKEKTESHRYELLLQNMHEQNPEKQKMMLTERGQQYLVAMEDIMYLLADGNYTHVHTGTKTFLASKNLKEFESILPPSVFYRIHNTHIVNTRFIVKIQQGRMGTAYMKDGKQLEIAARRKEAFMKMYKAS